MTRILLTCPPEQWAPDPYLADSADARVPAGWQTSRPEPRRPRYSTRGFSVWVLDRWCRR
jgi:hypothetical protein